MAGNAREVLAKDVNPALEAPARGSRYLGPDPHERVSYNLNVPFNPDPDQRQEVPRIWEVDEEDYFMNHRFDANSKGNAVYPGFPLGSETPSVEREAPRAGREASRARREAPRAEPEREPGAPIAELETRFDELETRSDELDAPQPARDVVDAARLSVSTQLASSQMILERFIGKLDTLGEDCFAEIKKHEDMLKQLDDADAQAYAAALEECWSHQDPLEQIHLEVQIKCQKLLCCHKAAFKNTIEDSKRLRRDYQHSILAARRNEIFKKAGQESKRLQAYYKGRRGIISARRREIFGKALEEVRKLKQADMDIEEQQGYLAHTDVQRLQQEERDIDEQENRLRAKRKRVTENLEEARKRLP
ncbi:hypothetical protein K490DRAFT_69417 [Saccharata proteae CBS 121410]|uniref:Uncharacterized protein n=1 Tax=Saccharata proteae CBS 121410 TaxID=1314787 RepID=A0A9P4HP16_9PEZI|nr:hypothetical protein K490DRAFT_69417 [Saccharata proteae CBS 121410]